MKERPLINRVLISLVTALSFVAMSLSGIAAFIMPEGKVAYWINWTFIGLSKSEWGNIHITTSVLFLIAGIWHIWYNWTHLMQYLKGIPGRVSASWRDLSIAVLVTLFFSAGAVTRTPPLNYILTFNNWIKESWVRTPADNPPFGHAELLSLKGFCKKMYIESEEALQELRQAGLTVTDENSTIEQIARTNRLTPAGVYQLIKKLEKPDIPQQSAVQQATVMPAARAEQKPALQKEIKADERRTHSKAIDLPRYTGDDVIERFEGKGIGKKTLSLICKELNLDCTRVKEKLAAVKMTIKDDETLKEAATRMGIVPIELFKTILVGEPIRDNQSPSETPDEKRPISDSESRLILLQK